MHLRHFILQLICNEFKTFKIKTKIAREEETGKNHNSTFIGSREKLVTGDKCFFINIQPIGFF